MVASVSHSTWPDGQSLVRTPADGGAFVPHQTASPTKAPFSPGRALETPKTPSASSTHALFISEVLADPPAGAAGDANRDGQRNGYEDEFVELYNAGQDTLTLAGWRLGDSTSPDTYFRFPPDSFIAPGSYVVSSAAAPRRGSPHPSISTTENRQRPDQQGRGYPPARRHWHGNRGRLALHLARRPVLVRTPPDGGAFVRTNRLPDQGPLFTRTRPRTSVRST